MPQKLGEEIDDMLSLLLRESAAREHGPLVGFGPDLPKPAAALGLVFQDGQLIFDDGCGHAPLSLANSRRALFVSCFTALIRDLLLGVIPNISDVASRFESALSATPRHGLKYKPPSVEVSTSPPVAATCPSAFNQRAYSMQWAANGVR